MSDVTAMEAMLRRWDESGLSLRGFGAREEIPYSRLVYWRRRLRPSTTTSKKTGSRPRPRAELVPVRVVSEESPSAETPGQLTAWLPNGVAIDVPTGFDSRELQRLVEVLAAC